MSIRDEVLRLIEAENEKFAAFCVKSSESRGRLEHVFDPVSNSLRQMFSAAPEFVADTYYQASASIKIGPNCQAGGPANFSWEVRVDFRRNPPDWEDGRPYFIIERQSYRDLLPCDSGFSKREFETETGLVEYVAGEFAAYAAGALRDKKLLAQWENTWGSNKNA